MKNKKNIKIILKVIIFILIGVIIFALISRILIPDWIKDDGSTIAIKSFYNEPKDSLDTVFVGNSSVYKSISPIELWKEYGITSYDYSSPEQRIWLSYYLIKECLIYQSPKVIFLNVDEAFTEDDATEQSIRKALDNMKYNGAKKEAMNDKIFNISNFDKLSYIFPILRYHSRWDSLNGDDLILDIDEYYTIHKGYVMSKNQKAYVKGNEDISQVSIGTKSTTYLEKIIDLCKENNIELVLMYIPSPMTWSENKNEEMQEFATSHNVRYIDMNINCDLDMNWDKDTEDGGWHLNLYGARKVTNYLGKILKEEYHFISHKDDEEYSYWYDDEQDYDVALYQL